MTLKCCGDYWLASGIYYGRKYLAEGKTRCEAHRSGLLTMAEIKHEAKSSREYSAA